MPRWLAILRDFVVSLPTQSGTDLWPSSLKLQGGKTKTRIFESRERCSTMSIASKGFECMFRTKKLAAIPELTPVTGRQVSTG